MEKAEKIFSFLLKINLVYF